MTRLAYFQPFSGASGDMVLGALVDAGLALEALEEGLRALGLDGWRLEARKELRGPFLTTRVRVLLEEGDRPDAEAQHQHQHHHHQQHHHHHHHHDHHDLEGSAHHHAHTHSHAGSAAPRRGLEEILALIRASSLPAQVREDSARVFRRLGEAEAKVHGVPLSEVHFHEVGAVDSIVDIVGACLGLHLLGVEEVHSAPVTVGTGFVRGDHGQMPLPAPATLELLRGFPIEQRDTKAELTTPTGAALLTTLGRSFSTLPPMVVEAIGYGAGNDRPGPVPNCLRVLLGRAAAGRPGGDRVLVLETAIDDMSPEWMGNLMDRLFAAGALDVSFTPLVMKKGRPGHEVRVILPLEKEEPVLRTLFSESTTFGLRRAVTERITLEREIHSTETPWGPVRIKVGKLGSDVMTAAVEFEDLRAAASRAGLPLKEVHRRILRQWEDKDEPGERPGG